MQTATIYITFTACLLVFAAVFVYMKARAERKRRKVIERRLLTACAEREQEFQEARQ